MSSLATLLPEIILHTMQNTTTDTWTTVPILPCINIEETLAFWTSLGFVTTYKQTRPYQYGVVQRGGAALHFGSVKGMTTDTNHYTGCLVAVPDAAAIYRNFAVRLKEQLGRVPHVGLPRISRMKPGATRFTLTDVAGNAVIFVSRGEKDQEEWEKAEHVCPSRLAKAIALAARYRDYKNDDALAAKVLDHALLNLDGEPAERVAEAWIIRAELADAEKDILLAATCREQAKRQSLTEEQLRVFQEKHD
jgi:hypothetical protein